MTRVSACQKLSTYFDVLAACSFLPEMENGLCEATRGRSKKFLHHMSVKKQQGNYSADLVICRSLALFVGLLR